MSGVYQCPSCELRFGAKWELDSHLANDHPKESEPVYDDEEE